MTIKRDMQTIRELTNEINILKRRIANYDWQYRLHRFDEKIQHERKEVTKKLEKIKSSD